MLLGSGLSGVLADAVYIISLSGFGIATLISLFLTPVILHRYDYEDLPGTELAPTFLIGIALTAVQITALETATGTLILLLAAVITFNTYNTAKPIKKGEAFPLS
jgi:hypothetical protein